MVTVPLRLLLVVFRATVTSTTPGPVPLAPETTVIHGALLTAVHVHPAVVMTSIRRAVTPFSLTFNRSGLISKLQEPAWLMVNTWPPIDTVPVLADPLLAATWTVTTTGPAPVRAEDTVSHDALVCTLHAQV